MDIKSVYDRQHQRIYRLAMLYLKNPSDAEDAVHNVFLRYMERLPIFEGSGHEEGWFVTVTRNYCKDQLRTCWYRKVSLGGIPERMDQEKEDYQLLEHMMKLLHAYLEKILPGKNLCRCICLTMNLISSTIKITDGIR